MKRNPLDLGSWEAPLTPMMVATEHLNQPLGAVNRGKVRIQHADPELPIADVLERETMPGEEVDEPPLGLGRTNELTSLGEVSLKPLGRMSEDKVSLMPSFGRVGPTLVILGNGFGARCAGRTNFPDGDRLELSFALRRTGETNFTFTKTVMILPGFHLESFGADRARDVEERVVIFLVVSDMPFLKPSPTMKT